ncbi:MAG: transglutaminase family protein [Zoogloeaceae bacterium]|jgi:transglutaminase-like putative cysteine protease|nr:transglutaminase family protein [Zoogloeaceae bacterium]
MSRYHVLHETRYHYGSVVSLSQQMLHLSPRFCAWQICREFALTLSPEPNWRRQGEDAFGNPVEWLAFYQPHERLSVRVEMRVDVLPHAPDRAREAASLSGAALAARLAYRSEPPLPEDLQAKRFLFESPHIRVKHELAEWSAPCFVPHAPVLESARRLMEKIYTEFEFDPNTTTVSTPVLEVLAKKRGVCQDFAHLMIACLRAHSIPARYMSGYLLTAPPPGQPRLVGADASHAWVSVYAPEVAGADGRNASTPWVDFDPTNNLLPDTQHITLAWGRDFSDISPMRGVILGGGGHEPEVAVTVTPEGRKILIIPV